MKNLIILVITLLISSCATDKYLLSAEEMSKSEFSTEAYTIKKGDEIIGRITSTEIEIDAKGNVVKELSITLEDVSKALDMDELLKYLHTRFPNKKIEVNLDGVVEFN